MSISSVETRNKPAILYEEATFGWPGVVPPSAEVKAEEQRRRLPAAPVDFTRREIEALYSSEVDNLSLEEQAVLNDKIRLKRIAHQVRTAIIINNELKGANPDTVADF